MIKATVLPGVEGAIDYLRQKFDWVDTRQTGSASCSVTVWEGSDGWRVNLSEEFLDAHSPEQVRRLLEEWNLAGEMRRAEGLDLTVSSAGVRLDSSN